ncbi:MAG: DUF7064 domain-containing protein [Panacagrimonas sp.]
MLTAQDAEFHHTPDSPWDWAETNLFSFYIPEARINGTIYLLARPMLGCAMADITIQDRLTFSWHDQLYVDNQQHLPCPKSLLDYSLPNGLHVKAVEPLKYYRIDYVGNDNTELHFDYKLFAGPFDINDPKMDPLAATRPGAAWDQAMRGHYEVTGHVTGEAIIRGKKYNVDCVETGDRSWGPRRETGNRNTAWLHGSYGRDFTFHLFAEIDPAHSEVLGQLISGYILEDGQYYGLTEVKGRTERRYHVPLSTECEVVDIRGKRFHFTGGAMNSSAWAPFPAMVYYQSLMRWNLGGKIGYGAQIDSSNIEYITKNRDLLLTR